MNFPQDARELVVRMLSKDPKTRVNIFEVKEHRWLFGHPPIRETISQTGLQIPLPDLNNDIVPSITKGYQIINESGEKAKLRNDRLFIVSTEFKEAPKTEMDMIEAEEDRECLRIITDKAVRMSLIHMKDRMNQVNSEYAVSKEKVETQTHKLNEMRKLVENYEKEITGKVTIFRHMQQNQKILILQIADKTFEIEGLKKNTDSTDILRKINKKSSRLIELASECKMKSKVLESLKSQISYYNVGILEKDKEIASLEIQKEMIQTKNQNSLGNLKSQVSELQINIAVLRSRILNHEKFNTEMCEEDSKVAIQIINLMKSKFSGFKHISENEINTQIDTLREKIIEKEQLNTEATLEYQDMKYKITQDLRRQKDKITSEHRARQEEIAKERKELLTNLKIELRDKLFLSRVQQEAFFVEDSEITESSEVLNVKSM